LFVFVTWQSNSFPSFELEKIGKSGKVRELNQLRKTIFKEFRRILRRFPLLSYISSWTYILDTLWRALFALYCVRFSSNSLGYYHQICL